MTEDHAIEARSINVDGLEGQGRHGRAGFEDVMAYDDPFRGGAERLRRDGFERAAGTAGDQEVERVIANLAQQVLVRMTVT
jgi:hypothetical protein